MGQTTVKASKSWFRIIGGHYISFRADRKVGGGAEAPPHEEIKVCCDVALRQNVKRATNWPDLGFVPAPLRVFTNP